MAFQLLSGYLPFDDHRNRESPALSKVWRAILTEDVAFKGKTWEEVPSAAKDFIKLLLTKWDLLLFHYFYSFSCCLWCHWELSIVHCSWFVQLHAFSSCLRCHKFAQYTDTLHLDPNSGLTWKGYGYGHCFNDQFGALGKACTLHECLDISP